MNKKFRVSNRGNKIIFILILAILAVFLARDPLFAASEVRINEIRNNDDSTDDIEFIELIGEAGLDLNGYYIIHHNGANGDNADIWRYDFSGSWVIPDDGITDNNGNALGFFVLGTVGWDPGAPVDDSLATATQNGDDGIVLYDSEGAIVDAVAWDAAADIATVEETGLTTTGSANQSNYLHIIGNDSTTDTCRGAPDNVDGDDGSGWPIQTATPGAINANQTGGSIDIGAAGVGAPTVTISAATSVEEITARINGNVTATGGADPEVIMYWGDNDGGQTPGSWDNNSEPTSPSQPQGVAAFYKDVTGLSPGTLYYFSAKATNSGGTDWPAASLNFLTKPNPPTNLASSDVQATTATVSWDAPAAGSVDGYYIRYKEGSTPTSYTDGAGYTQSETTKGLTGLNPNTHYYCKVWSYATDSPNAGGCCDDPGASAECDFTTLVAAPTVTSITPSSGYAGTSVDITDLAGTNFVDGATVKLTKTGESDINATSVVVVSSTQITCTFDLTGAATSTWDVVVTTAGGSDTLTNGFTVTTPPALTVTSITPSSGPNSGTIDITDLAGTDFISGATVKLTKTGETDIDGTSVNVASSTQITCTFDLTGAATGTWNVVVTTAGGSGTLTNGFTIGSSDSSVLKISEVCVGTTGASIEFIELYNPTSTPVYISSITSANFKMKLLQGGAATTLTTKVVIWNKNIVPAYGFFLFGVPVETFTPTPDAGWATPALTGSSGVVITDASDVVIDKVGWGNITAEGVTLAVEGTKISETLATGDSIERKAYSNSTTTDMWNGGAHVNDGNSYDSNNNANDFVVHTTTGHYNPQNSSSDTETPSAGEIKITITKWRELY